ncbi:hypothetical protein RM779_05865 [Streptomyces sp. DSM 41886]|uniref:Uncharacterized protein n=1 Tax=Streptomyces johnsoniae TaxID=3075532 RepID=A0ABU2S037_9ACTN|nr:hypothetical protein [Streptomyces sp. DSM 41886]
MPTSVLSRTGPGLSRPARPLAPAERAPAARVRTRAAGGRRYGQDRRAAPARRVSVRAGLVLRRVPRAVLGADGGDGAADRPFPPGPKARARRRGRFPPGTAVPERL